MKCKLLILLSLSILLLAGCELAQDPFSVGITEEVHPGAFVTVTVTPIAGATYKYEIMRGNDVVYTRQDGESEKEFEVEWWPWSCQVTATKDLDVYGPEIVSPLMVNESPIINRPKLGAGDDWYIPLVSMQEYSFYCGASYDQYGNELGVRDPDGDDWHIVSIVIQEDGNQHETTVITCPYVEGVYQFNGFDDAFGCWFAWSGDQKNGMYYLPFPYGNGYWFDPKKCAERNLADKMNSRDASITITVEDEYGAAATETFWLRVMPWTCK